MEIWLYNKKTMITKPYVMLKDYSNTHRYLVCIRVAAWRFVSATSSESTTASSNGAIWIDIRFLPASRINNVIDIIYILYMQEYTYLSYHCKTKWKTKTIAPSGLKLMRALYHLLSECYQLQTEAWYLWQYSGSMNLVRLRTPIPKKQFREIGLALLVQQRLW